MKRGSETVQNVNTTLRIWGERIFGPRAVQRQKWYLRNDDEVRKARGEHIREWDGRMESSIADFELVMSLSLDDADRLDLLLRAVPTTWMRELYKQGRKPEDLSRDEALDLFERLETAESITESAVIGSSFMGQGSSRASSRPALMGPRNDRRNGTRNDRWNSSWEYRPRQNQKQGFFRAGNKTPARINTGQASRRAVRDTARQFPRQNYTRAGQPSLYGNRNYRYGNRQYGSLEENGRDAIPPRNWNRRNQRTRGVNRNSTWRTDNPVETHQRQQREDAARTNREAHAMQKVGHDGDASDDSGLGF